MSSHAPTAQDRRIYPRVPVSGSASIRLLGEIEDRPGRVVDLSRSGAQIETAPLPAGTRIRASFLGLQVTATVVRAIDDVGGNGSPGIAVRFDEVQDPDWKAIRVRRE